MQKRISEHHVEAHELQPQKNPIGAAPTVSAKNRKLRQQFKQAH